MTSGCDPVLSHRLLNTLASVKGLSVLIGQRAAELPPESVLELEADLCEVINEGHSDARQVTGPGREQFLNRMAALFGAAETLRERRSVSAHDQHALVDIVSRQADEAAAALLICMQSGATLEEAEDIASAGR